MATSTLYTAEEFLYLEDEPYRHVLIDGEVHRLQPRDLRSGILVAEVGRMLYEYLRDKHLGTAMVGSGYVLARDPDSVVGPAISFLRAERRPPPEARDRYIEGPPDLAIEIVTYYDPAWLVFAAIGELLKAGTRLLWVIAPEREAAFVYHQGRAGTFLTAAGGDMLDGGDVLPGLRLSLADVFND